MTLPALTIPEIPLPIEIPELLHPAIVHFVIAIPVVVFLLEVYNLVARKRSISLFSFFLLIVVALLMFGAYLTGGVDGKATWDILSAEAQTDLKAHKLLGTYLVYGSGILVLLKLLFMAIGKTFGRILFILILGGFIAVTLNQGKEGGELVYKYGANNEVVTEMKSDAEDMAEEQEELKEKFDGLQEKYNTLLEESKAPKATPTPAPEEEETPSTTSEESESSSSTASEESDTSESEEASTSADDEETEESNTTH